MAESDVCRVYPCMTQTLMHVSCMFKTEFFPFGEANGDIIATPVDDGSFGPIKLDVPIVFFQSEESLVYVRMLQ